MVKKALILASFTLLSIHGLHAQSGLETSVTPEPPYTPGTKVRVRVSGPGMVQLQNSAFIHLVGNSSTDYMQRGMVYQKGSPPAFEWTFTAPEYSNTPNPQLD